MNVPKLLVSILLIIVLAIPVETGNSTVLVFGNGENYANDHIALDPDPWDWTESSTTFAISDGFLYLRKSESLLGRSSQDVLLHDFSGGGIIASASQEHAFFVRDGFLYAFGSGSNGKLGLGGHFTQSQPKALRDAPRDVTDLSLGDRHSLVLAGGVVYSVGEGGSGQLGLGTPRSRARLTAIRGFDRVTAVYAGTDTSFFVQDGVLYAFGSGRFGALGGGDTRDRLRPTPVKGMTAVEAFATRSHHALVVRGGELFVFGANTFGQLCLGDTANRLVPTAVPGLRAVTAVAAGQHFTLAIADGRLYFCGYCPGCFRAADFADPQPHPAVFPPQTRPRRRHRNASVAGEPPGSSHETNTSAGDALIPALSARGAVAVSADEGATATDSIAPGAAAAAAATGVWPADALTPHPQGGSNGDVGSGSERNEVGAAAPGGAGDRGLAALAATAEGAVRVSAGARDGLRDLEVGATSRRIGAEGPGDTRMGMGARENQDNQGMSETVFASNTGALPEGRNTYDAGGSAAGTGMPGGGSGEHTMFSERQRQSGDDQMLTARADVASTEAADSSDGVGWRSDADSRVYGLAAHNDGESLGESAGEDTVGLGLREATVMSVMSVTPGSEAVEEPGRSGALGESGEFDEGNEPPGGLGGAGVTGDGAASTWNAAMSAAGQSSPQVAGVGVEGEVAPGAGQRDYRNDDDVSDRPEEMRSLTADEALDGVGEFPSAPTDRASSVTDSGSEVVHGGAESRPTGSDSERERGRAVTSAVKSPAALRVEHPLNVAAGYRHFVVQTDVDDCSSGLHHCDLSRGMMCVNELGGYRCQCVSGFERTESGECTLDPFEARRLVEESLRPCVHQCLRSPASRSSLRVSDGTVPNGAASVSFPTLRVPPGVPLDSDSDSRGLSDHGERVEVGSVASDPAASAAGILGSAEPQAMERTPPAAPRPPTTVSSSSWCVRECAAAVLPWAAPSHRGSFVVNGQNDPVTLTREDDADTRYSVPPSHSSPPSRSTRQGGSTVPPDVLSNRASSDTPVPDDHGPADMEGGLEKCLSWCEVEGWKRYSTALVLARSGPRELAACACACVLENATSG